MQSKFLSSLGVKNYISGKEFNMRAAELKEKVAPQAKKIMEIMGIKPKEVYCAYQIHSDVIRYCDGENGTPFFYGKEMQECDGLITDIPNIALVTKFADCTPVILFDNKNKVLCSIHSGWRGTVKMISKKGIQMMEDKFSSNREDIFAYIGPSIDMEHYEVGVDVYDAFQEFKKRDCFFKINPENKDKFLLSMTDANLDILIENGIKRENIEVSRTSTYLDKNLHSYRRDKENYGVNSMFVMM